MNNRTYLMPGLAGWTFKTSDTGYGLWSANDGPGVAVTADMPATEISERVKALIWFNFKVSREVSEAAAKAVLIIDWQAMIREAGTDVQHQTPSLPGWTLRISDVSAGLWHISGAVVQITEDAPISEIAEGVRRVLQHSLPQVEIDVQVDEVMRIDFKALITNAWTAKVAPLLDGCTADNTALVNEICADVRLLVSFQKSDNTELGNEICALVRKIAE